MQGGSALFLNTRMGNVHNCRYIDNVGSSSACKIVTSFKSSSGSSVRLLGEEANSIVFSDCKFKAYYDTKSLIHFVIGNGASNVEFNNYIFVGNLRDGSHYIDEQIVENNSPLLKIKACKFSYGIKKSLNLDPKHDPSLIDFNDQVFNYSEFNESKQKSWKLIVAIVVPAFAVVSIFVVIAIIIRKRNRNDNSDDQDNLEITTSLIQDSSLI